MRFIGQVCFLCSEESELEANVQFIPNRADGTITWEWIGVCYECFAKMDVERETYPDGIATRPYNEEFQRRLV